jgi:Kef-type K+ transport system membrane component KefB
VQERGIHKTKLGAIVITCAAADDITAWCILAVVIAIVKAGTFVSSLYIIMLAILYVAAMIYIVKPFLKDWRFIWIKRQHRKTRLPSFFWCSLFRPMLQR